MSVEEDEEEDEHERERGGSHTVRVPTLIQAGETGHPKSTVAYQAVRDHDGEWYVSSVGPAGTWTMAAGDAALTAAALSLAVADCLRFAKQPHGPVREGIDR